MTPADHSSRAGASASGRLGWRELLVISALFVALTVAFTWPLASRMGDAIPGGSDPPTVCLFQLFVMEWNVKYFDGEAPFWDAPFYHPHRGALAWSESQPLSGLAVWALGKLGLKPTPAYNVLILFYLASAAAAVYALARQVTTDRAASFVCGFSAGCGAYLMHQLAVLPMLAIVFPAWFLFALFELGDRFRWRTLAVLVLAFLCTWFSCAQYGFFLVLLAPVAFFGAYGFRSVRPAKYVKLAAAFVPAAAALAPFLRAQLRVLDEMGFQRSMREIEGTLYVPHLFIPARGHWLTDRVLHLLDRPELYSRDVGVVLGLLLVAGAACGFFASVRRDPASWPRVRAHALVAAAAFVLSFGPRIGVAAGGREWGPYGLLAAVVPGLDGVRSPARFLAFTMLGLAVLAAAALAHLRARVSAAAGRRGLPGAGGAVLAAAGLLVAAEAFIVPLAMVATGEVTPRHAQAAAWLKERADGGAVLEFPLPRSGGAAELEREVRAMRRALVHGHPIVNGYSSHIPVASWQLAHAVWTDPAGRGVAFMGAMGVRYVLLHDRAVPAPHREALLATSVAAHRFGEDITILEMAPLPADPPRRVEIPDGFRFPRMPAAEQVVGIPLKAPVERPTLLPPYPPETARLEWDGERPGSARFELLGSLLLDRGERAIYLRVLRAPGRRGQGKAAYLSREEAAVLAKRR